MADAEKSGPQSGGGTGRLVARLLLAAIYLTAGVFHIVQPQPFLGITPYWVPLPSTVVLLTGLAELAAVPALLQPWSRPLRRAAGIGLALYATCVYPANVNHMLIDLAKPFQAWASLTTYPVCSRSRWSCGRHCGLAKSSTGPGDGRAQCER